jgi:hypothetical protein
MVACVMRNFVKDDYPKLLQLYIEFSAKELRAGATDNIVCEISPQHKLTFSRRELVA